MISVRQGGCVFGPGVFMFENEAAAVKTELTTRGTKEARRLADEIGMPSDGRAYASGLAETDCERAEDVFDELRAYVVEQGPVDEIDDGYVVECCDRISAALERELALRLAK